MVRKTMILSFVLLLPISLSAIGMSFGMGLSSGFLVPSYCETHGIGPRLNYKIEFTPVVGLDLDFYAAFGNSKQTDDETGFYHKFSGKEFGFSATVDFQHAFKPAIVYTGFGLAFSHASGTESTGGGGTPTTTADMPGVNYFGFKVKVGMETKLNKYVGLYGEMANIFGFGSGSGSVLGQDQWGNITPVKIKVSTFGSSGPFYNFGVKFHF